MKQKTENETEVTFSCMKQRKEVVLVAMKTVIAVSFCNNDIFLGLLLFSQYFL